MNFSIALNALKQGEKISRKSWNGIGMYVYIIYDSDDINIVNIEPFFVIKNVKGTLNTWIPSISDLLAEDWQIIN